MFTTMSMLVTSGLLASTCVRRGGQDPPSRVGHDGGKGRKVRVAHPMLHRRHGAATKNSSLCALSPSGTTFSFLCAAACCHVLPSGGN